MYCSNIISHPLYHVYYTTTTTTAIIITSCFGHFSNQMFYHNLIKAMLDSTPKQTKGIYINTNSSKQNNTNTSKKSNFKNDTIKTKQK